MYIRRKRTPPHNSDYDPIIMKELDAPYVEMARDFRPWLSFNDLRRRTGMNPWTLMRHLKKLKCRHRIIELKVHSSKDPRPRARGKRLKVDKKIYSFYHVYVSPETRVRLDQRFYDLLARHRTLGQIIGTKTNDSSRYQIGRQPNYPSAYVHELLDRLSLVA